jgi:hypothetical protein
MLRPSINPGNPDAMRSINVTTKTWKGGVEIAGAGMSSADDRNNAERKTG